MCAAPCQMCIRDRYNAVFPPLQAFGVGYTGVPAAFIPVSYTHLDVYKRQARCACSTACILLRRRREGRLLRKDENSAYKVGWIALIGLLPLLGGDVYKRQVQPFASAPVQPAPAATAPQTPAAGTEPAPAVQQTPPQLAAQRCV